MFYSFEESQKLSKNVSDAALKSFSALMESAQTISNEVADYSKKAFEQNTTVMEKMVGAKTLEKAIEIQNAYAKSAYSDYVAGATRITEIASEATKTVYKPVEDIVVKAAPKAAATK